MTVEELRLRKYTMMRFASQLVTFKYHKFTFTNLNLSLHMWILRIFLVLIQLTKYYEFIIRSYCSIEVVQSESLTNKLDITTGFMQESTADVADYISQIYPFRWACLVIYIRCDY